MRQFLHTRLRMHFAMQMPVHVRQRQARKRQRGAMRVGAGLHRCVRPRYRRAHVLPDRWSGLRPTRIHILSVQVPSRMRQPANGSRIWRRLRAILRMEEKYAPMWSRQTLWQMERRRECLPLPVGHLPAANNTRLRVLQRPRHAHTLEADSARSGRQGHHAGGSLHQ